MTAEEGDLMAWIKAVTIKLGRWERWKGNEVARWERQESDDVGRWEVPSFIQGLGNTG